jgi:hypothetical protein
MGDFDEQLFREAHWTVARDEEDRAANVLLQVVLPLVMILAILVNQVPILKKQFDQLVRDVTATPTDGLRNELDVAVLTLQHQLLLQATDQVAADERGALRVGIYGESIPSSSELAQGVVSDSFREISIALADRFNGPGRARARKRLLERVQVVFANLAEPYVGNFESGRQETLLAISKDNRILFETKLEGHLSGIEREASDAQSELVLAWLSAPPTARVKEDSAAIWIRIAAGESELVQSFDDLKVKDLFDRLSELGVVVLKTVEEAVL